MNRNNPAYFYKLYLRSRYHIVCWSVLIFYELAIFYYSTGILGSIPKYIFYYGCNISLFYVHLRLLNNTAGKTPPRYLKAISFIVLELFFFLAIKIIFDYLTNTSRSSLLPYFRDIRQIITLNLFRICYFAGISTLFWSASRMSEFRNTAAENRIRQLSALAEKAELETKLAQTNNAYLQQQLNPHLLFNTLNFVYNTVFNVSAAGADCVLRLSEILRFSLEPADENGKILLAEEIRQIESLVQINRYRFSWPLQISLDISGIDESRRIIPLVLLTLTENLFKHGNLKQPARLHIAVDPKGMLSYSVSNAKKAAGTARGRTGIGMENTRTRLEYAYSGNYNLNITETETKYDLLLIVQL